MVFLCSYPNTDRHTHFTPACQWSTSHPTYTSLTPWTFMVCECVWRLPVTSLVIASSILKPGKGKKGEGEGGGSSMSNSRNPIWFGWKWNRWEKLEVEGWCGSIICARGEKTQNLQTPGRRQPSRGYKGKQWQWHTGAPCRKGIICIMVPIFHRTLALCDFV